MYKLPSLKYYNIYLNINDGIVLYFDYSTIIHINHIPVSSNVKIDID